MPKWTGEIIGGLEIAAGAALAIASGGTMTPLAGMLIAAGAGAIISGLGTLLSKGPAQGFATTMRNSVAPWKVVYGRQRVGGTIVFVNMWPPAGGGFLGTGIGGSAGDVILDLVIVLAAHNIESVDAVLFDMQRVQIDTTKAVFTHQVGSGAMSSGPYPGTGVSFTPKQQGGRTGDAQCAINSIQRVNGVVTVNANANIPYLIVGDQVQIEDNGGGSLLTNNNLAGRVQVAQILVQTTGSLIFTYLNGGANVGPIVSNGSVNTLWADYGRSVYFEPMLGGQSLGQSFNGMVFGTPLDGDLGDIVSPATASRGGGIDTINPWTSYCSLMGKSAVHLRLHYNSTYYKGGLPQISFLVHGKNDILDPRTSPPVTGYSENAALCIADFLSNAEWGFKAAYSTEIPLPLLNAAANTCDEAVPLAYSLSSPPLTEPAYALNGQFDLTMKRGEILQNMLTACAGRLTYVSGQYAIWPAAWIGNSWAIGSNPGGGVIPLPAFSPIAAGGIKWRTPSERELFNGVKGTYISQANKWQSTDFPPYCQDALHGYSGPSLYGGDINLAYDLGDRRWLDIQLPFTISYSTAQRIAKIELLRRRNSGGNPRAVVTLTLNMVAYQIAPLDLLLLNIPYMGWVNKQFEVIGMRFVAKDGGAEEGPKLVVEVDLQEIDQATYDWDTTEELSPQGYVQPQIPGVGSFLFFATELVPGYNVPFPWEPGYILPFVGDALYGVPALGGPKVCEGQATFGLQVQYGLDAQGNSTAVMDIEGAYPPNDLSTIAPPQLISAIPGTAGNLPPGTYYIAASAIDAVTGANSMLGTANKVTIPAPSPTANTGSIAITVAWPPGSNGGEIYVALASTRAGYYFQVALSSSATTYAFTEFNQSTPGAPDPSIDHLAVAWKKVVHGGPFAVQVQSVTSNSVTLGGTGMTPNQWVGYVATLLGKLDSTQQLPILNMPISASSASTGLSPGISVQASITGTFTAKPTDGQTAIIAGKTYTFKSTLTNVDGYVYIGVFLEDAVVNLRAAVSLGAGAGSSYAAATTPNANAYADDSFNSSPTITCYAILAGPGGNSLTASGTAPITWANSGDFAGGSSPDEFTITIGPNANGDQLPDLTTLLVEGDLVVMRFNPTFTASSFTDPNIANPFYPQGATGVEPGHLVMVMTGPDAGDIQTISAVSQDGSGNWTIFDISGTWAITPNDGDIVIIVEASWGPEFHFPGNSTFRNQVSGVVASPPITNLAGQTLLFIVRSQDLQDVNGDDSYARIRECYIFGAQGTRTITTSQTMLPTDRILDVDATAGPVTVTLLPFATIPNQTIFIQKIDASVHPVTWVCAGSPPQDNVNGASSGVLTVQEQGKMIVVSGNG